MTLHRAKRQRELVADLAVGEVSEEGKFYNLPAFAGKAAERLFENESVRYLANGLFDRNLPIVRRATGAWGPTALGPQVVDCFEPGDTDQPGAHGSPLGIESMSAIPCRQEDDLNQILRVSADKATGNPVHQTGMLVEDFLQGSLVAGNEALLN